MKTLEQLRHDSGRAFRANCGTYDAIEAGHVAIAEAQRLLAEIDTILAKSAKSMIEEYYRPDQGGEDQSAFRR